jgi:hypothetical protein
MKKRQFSLAMAGIAVAALLSSAPAMAQAYNENNTGWNRGGTLKTDTVGKTPMCFKTFGSGQFDGPRLISGHLGCRYPWMAEFLGPVRRGRERQYRQFFRRRCPEGPEARASLTF